MDRTLRAAVLAALIALLTVAGVGWFLGIELGPSVVAGLVLAVLAALLILGAARRADSFHRTDGSPTDPTDPAFDDEDR